MHRPACPLLALILVTVFLLVGCSPSEPPEPIPSAPLAGTVDGRGFELRSAFAEPDEDGHVLLLLRDHDAECGHVALGWDGERTIGIVVGPAWRSTASWRWSEEEQLAWVCHGHSRCEDGRGRLEVDATSDGDSVVRLELETRSGDRVAGQVRFTACP